MDIITTELLRRDKNPRQYDSKDRGKKGILQDGIQSQKGSQNKKKKINDKWDFVLQEGIACEEAT